MNDFRFETSLMRVLVAEDDPLAAQVLEVTARKAGIAIETVPNGLDAADRVAAAPIGHYNAVLLDMRMPIMDGREAARRIRDLPYERGTLPIFAMSGSETELLRHPWATWLFDGHLTKPLRHSDFLSLLHQHGSPCSGRRAKSAEPDSRNAIVERVDHGEREIDDALARSDFTEAGEAAKRMRLCLLGLVTDDLIRALHMFQLGLEHGRKDNMPFDELKQCINTARRTLVAA